MTAVVRRRDDGSERRVRASYMVAADGSKGHVRERLGIAPCGRPRFSNSITIYFRADVKPLVGERNLSVIYVFGPRLQGFFRFSKTGDAGFLVVNPTTDAGGTRNCEGGHERGSMCRVRARGARRAGARGRDRERAAMDRVRRVGGAVPGRPDLPRRGRGPQHAAHRRLRRQHPGRENPLEPSGRPGTRAPHVELDGRSTLDLFGRGFVVLSPAEEWCASARSAGLEAHRLESPAFTEIYGTGVEGAVLVRPDGVIAWRTRSAAREPESVLARPSG